MKNKLNKIEFISISVMLFGMFFGAGNLIFPPLLGYLAGENVASAFIGFSLSAIILPILAVVAVSKTYGLENLASRVNRKFAILYTVLIFLAIGPGLAMPRTATVPFEMAIMQYLPENFNLSLTRAIFTTAFFAITYILSVNETKAVESSGKILSPLLILFIVLLFIGVLTKSSANIAQPKGQYLNSPLVNGFIEGYGTLDALAGLNFGLIIYMTLKKLGVEDKNKAIGYVVKSGIIAGAILAVIYLALAYMGYITSGIENLQNGAQIISYLSDSIFGSIGSVIVIAIFTLACLTTCIGLLLNISDYFATLTKNIDSKNWKRIICLVSLLLANFGLNTIMSYTVPILLILYPFSIALILLGLTHDKLSYTKQSYIAVAIITFFISIISVIDSTLKIQIPGLTKLVSSLPLKEDGLEWLIPSLIVLIIVQLITKNKNIKNKA